MHEGGGKLIESATRCKMLIALAFAVKLKVVNMYSMNLITNYITLIKHIKSMKLKVKVIQRMYNKHENNWHSERNINCEEMVGGRFRIFSKFAVCLIYLKEDENEMNYSLKTG
jgi:hypothetical protein